MEEGEEGAEIQDQGLAQATVASESRDVTEKDGAGNQDSEEENHEEEEDQTGNSWELNRGSLPKSGIKPVFPPQMLDELFFVPEVV